MQNNSQHFVLMAQPRTGSSTLVKLLNVHPDIHCYHEPFNHAWGIPFDPTYLECDPTIPSAQQQISDPNTLSTYQHWICAYSDAVFDAVLDSLYRQHNGIKHLSYGLTPEKNKRLLHHARGPIILLTRGNKLQQAVSDLISMTANHWASDRNAVITQDYSEITLPKTRAMLNFLRRDESFLRETVRSLNVPLLDIKYEDLYSPTVSLEEKINHFYHMVEFLGFSLTPLQSPQALELIRSLFDPDKQKLNSEITYGLIPDVLTIEQELGNDENGYLFPHLKHLLSQPLDPVHKPLLQLEHLVTQSPGKLDMSNLQRGNDLYRQGNFVEAIAAYRLHLQINPNSTWANCNLGEALLKIGQPEKAKEMFEQALRTNPKNSYIQAHLDCIIAATKD